MNDNGKLTLEDINKIVYPNHFQPSQWEVLRLRLLGYTFPQIAQELYISISTAYSRMYEIRQILHLVGNGYRRQKDLIKWAIENKLITIHF